MRGGWKNKKCADLTPEEWEKKRAHERKRWREWSPEKRRQKSAKYVPWYKKNIGKAREQTYDRNLIHKYGITRKDYDAMVLSQAGRCKVCNLRPIMKKNRPLFVDHNHKTGKVRALLCSRCNIFVGYLETHPGLLLVVQQYLVYHS